MDYAHRQARESALARAIARMTAGQRRKLFAIMGNPPKLENVTEVYWNEHFAAWQSVLTPELESIFIDSAALMLEDNIAIGVDWALVNQDAADWARTYGGTLIRGIDDSTRGGVNAAVTDFYDEGLNLGQLREKLGRWYGPMRADMIATTEVTRASVEGERAVVDEAEKLGFEMVEVWQTNNDEMVCSICGPRHQQPEGSNWTKFDGPPAHPRCILPGNEVVTFGPISAMAKSFYVGRCVEITLADGGQLAVTENHPILTHKGWVAAKLLSQGDDVICAARPERIASSIEPDYDQRPALIEDVFDSFVESGPVSTISMPAAAEDLHGDGGGVEGDINVVSAHGLLLADIEARLSKLRGKLSLNWNDAAPVLLTSQCVSAHFVPRYDTPTRGAMGGVNLGSSLCKRHSGPLGSFRRALPAWFDPSLQEALPESPAVNTSLAGEFLLRFTSDVTLKEIVEIRYFNTRSHVYDLQVDLYQLYTCNGVLASNCRCWTTHELVQLEAQ